MPIGEGKAAPAFTLEDEFSGKISLKDFRDSHTRFVRKHKLNFTLLSDPTMKVMAKYSAYGEKTMYGRKTVGVIRSTVWKGPNGKVKKHWKRVSKVADHPAHNFIRRCAKVDA